MSDFRVQGEVSLDGSKFLGGMKQMELAAHRTGTNIVNSLGTRLAALFTVGAISSFISKTIELADKFEDLKGKTGVGAEDLQRFDRAMRDNGSTLESLIGFWEKLSIARQSALNDKGGSEAQAFKAFGVSAKDLESKSAVDLSRKIALAVQSSSNIEALITPLRQIGGRGATEMVAALRAGLDQMYKDVSVMTDATTSEVSSLKDSWQNMITDLHVSTAPFLVWMVDNFRATFRAISEGKTALEAFKNAGGGIGGLVAGVGIMGGAATMELAKIDVERSRKIKTDEENKRIRDSLKFSSTKPEIVKPGGPIKSDSLLAVGNFLGASRSGLANYAAQQIDQQKITNQKLGEISNKLGKGDELGLP